MPGIGSNPIRDKASEEAIEIEQEQDGSAMKSIDPSKKGGCHYLQNERDDVPQKEDPIRVRCVRIISRRSWPSNLLTN